MSEDNRDRRHSNRVNVEVRLRLWAYRNGKRLALSGQVNDISQGGVSAYVSANLEIDETLEIELMLPYSTSPTRARVVVRSRTNYRYGLQFVDLPPKQLEALARACKLLELMK